jgi:hypothetical protein
LKKVIAALLAKFGYALVKTGRASYHDITEQEFWELYDFCRPYTMTSVERMYALYKSVQYVLDAQVPGDFVECGVWRGGSSMLVAKMLAQRGLTNRQLYLYDTFEGMSEPTEKDVDVRGVGAARQLEQSVADKENSVWCLADLQDVTNNMAQTGYPMAAIKFVKGKVEDTIPQTMPAHAVALLRLDTDWYESTKHELEHLYPTLVAGGVLVIDDYGHWAGCRKAVDEYFAAIGQTPLLSRVDYTGRLFVKP